jgi:hypothetical protein
MRYVYFLGGLMALGLLSKQNVKNKMEKAMKKK